MGGVIFFIILSLTTYIKNEGKTIFRQFL